MKHILSIYKHIIVLNFSVLLAHRANLIGQLIGTILWTFLAIFTMSILADRAHSVAGWDQADLLLLTGGLTISIGLFSFLCKKSFQHFPEIILYGELDGLLLKPIDSQYLVSLSIIHFPSLIRVLTGIAFTWYVISAFAVPVSVISIVSFIIFICLGVIIYYSLWMMACTLLIWFPRLSNILEVTNSLNHVSRFPPEVYQEVHMFLFILLLPYTFVLATPVNLLLQRASLIDVASMIFCTLLLFFLSRKFWHYALRYYGSASG